MLPSEEKGKEDSMLSPSDTFGPSRVVTGFSYRFGYQSLHLVATKKLQSVVLQQVMKWRITDLNR